MGLDKSWNTIVFGVLFGSPKPGTAHIASEIIATRQLVTGRAQFRQFIECPWGEQCLGTLSYGCSGTKKSKTKTVAKRCPASHKSRFYSGKTRQSVIHIETKCTAAGRQCRQFGKWAKQTIACQCSVSQFGDIVTVSGTGSRSELLPWGGCYFLQTYMFMFSLSEAPTINFFLFFRKRDQLPYTSRPNPARLHRLNCSSSMVPILRQKMPMEIRHTILPSISMRR